MNNSESETENNIDIDIACDNEHNNSITVELGKIFGLIMISNPTTGYNWYMTNDEKELGLVSPVNLNEMNSGVYTANEHRPGICGCGGKTVFRFKANKKGNEYLKFVYRRLWEEGIKPIKEIEINIKID